MTRLTSSCRVNTCNNGSRNSILQASYKPPGFLSDHIPFFSIGNHCSEFSDKCFSWSLQSDCLFSIPKQFHVAYFSSFCKAGIFLNCLSMLLPFKPFAGPLVIPQITTMKIIWGFVLYQFSYALAVFQHSLPCVVLG